MFRNRELRRFALVFAIIAAASITLGFFVNYQAGLLSITFSVIYGIAFWIFTRARYKSIAEISDQIDLVLHDADHLFIGESGEGELSILQSEIIKMTVRIREQNDALKNDKKYLADSLADIAHQLRTPLTSANLILSLLKNNPDEEEQRTLIRETEELFVKMDWLLTSLLKLSRLDAGIVVFKREQIEIARLIHDSVRPLLISMELHNVTVKTDIPEGIRIQGDLSWLSQAILNILKNCMESAGNNGKIEINCIDNPLFTELSIHDSGKGFEKEELHRLFERFYRGKNDNTTGYGIGLALSRVIITRQGGTVTAKNHPEGGAVFLIRFPK